MSFESRLLYEQYSSAEEGTNVLTSIYAILWTYPGAMTKTSARIRTTFVYQTAQNEVMLLGGTIEKWRNEGWSLLDEYHDTISTFGTLEECKKRLISMAESFLMGTPLEEVDEDYFPPSDTPQPTSGGGKSGQPSLKVIDYHSKKKEDSDKKAEKEKSKKDDDFDWI